MCHQKSGSCSAVANSEAMTIRTPPSSSVLVLSRCVRFSSSSPPGTDLGSSAARARRKPGSRRQQLGADEVDERQRARPAGGRQVDADRGRDLPEVDGVAAQPVGAAGHQPARLGGDRERPAQEGQPPDGVDEADRGEDVAGQHQPFPPLAAWQEGAQQGREGAGERDDDHAQPVVGAALGQPGAVEDDQHREVAEREHLAQDEQVVAEGPGALDRLRQLQHLVGDEQAEKEGRKHAAEYEIAPVRARPPLRPNPGSHHVRAGIYQPGAETRMLLASSRPRRPGGCAAEAGVAGPGPPRRASPMRSSSRHPLLGSGRRCRE